MVEYLVVIVIVSVAVYVAIKKTATQLRGRGCDGCNCRTDEKKFGKMLKAGPGPMKDKR